MPEMSTSLFNLTFCIAKDIEVFAPSPAADTQNLCLAKACLPESLERKDPRNMESYRQCSHRITGSGNHRRALKDHLVQPFLTKAQSRQDVLAPCPAES